MWSGAIGRHVRMNTTLLRGGRGPAVGLYVSLLNGTRASRGADLSQPRGCLRDGAETGALSCGCRLLRRGGRVAASTPMPFGLWHGDPDLA